MLKRFGAGVGLVLALLVGGMVLWLPAGSGNVNLVAASSLADVLEAQIQRLQSPDSPPVRLSTAGSQTVARQIVAGNPADVVFLAHPRWMQHLEDKGELREGTRRTLLTNRLVLIGPAGSASSIQRISQLKTFRGRVAVGNPEAVPAGIYARRALKTLELWSKLSDQIVSFPHVRAVLSAVESGNLPLGIVYRTDAILLEGVQILDRIPPENTPPIRYQVALTRRSGEHARRVYDGLTDTGAHRIYRQFGFIVVETRD